MLPSNLYAELQRVESRAKNLDLHFSGLEDEVQYAFSNQLVLLASGYVESFTKGILSEYASTRSDVRLRAFVEREVSYLNSLNCEKIEKLLKKFDPEWWEKLAIRLDDSERESVDSLKTLRDKIAHGKHNGTGFVTVRNYYGFAKSFGNKMAEIILE